MSNDTNGSLAEALANGHWLLDGDPAAAADQAEAILEITPRQTDALRLLGMAYRRLGRDKEAQMAEAGAIEESLGSPSLQAAAASLMRDDLATAERLTREVLRQSPRDVAANILLAEIASRLGIYPEAERRLREAREIAPDFVDVMISLALVLFAQSIFDESLELLAGVLERQPDHIRAATAKADILAQTGDYSSAAEVYATLLEKVPDQADVWLWYGHLLKTIGQQDNSVEAYRRAVSLDPDLAEAWWSLAELKANRVTEDDIDAMKQGLAKTRAPDKRLHLHFALGKAFEDRSDWATSFQQYEAGNAARLSVEPHDRTLVTQEVARSISLFDRRFYSVRSGWGNDAPDPIFVIGMPRAGSTLVEQILASHSQIEGTSELPDIPLIVQSLVAARWQDQHASYPAIVDGIDVKQCAELGARYLSAAARHRKTDAPFFVDKLPNNWRYLGLIKLILPNAKLIDARRGAMACCFSNFKQHFARGQTFAYSQADIGGYYRDYVRLMEHFGLIFPETIHRVEHEVLTTNPEGEIRRLLDYLNLPFEEACLRPHENTRAVRTASSEQVRRPISAEAMNQWRNYEPWLSELKEALGSLAR